MKPPHTTFDIVRDQLHAALDDRDYKVLSLKGEWGTGKTYMWDVVAESLSTPLGEESPIYVSLFGANSLTELRMRVLQATYLHDKSKTMKSVRTVAGGIRAWVNKLTGGAIDMAADVWLPELVGARLIVLDDIERRNAALTLDQIFGLVDQFSKKHGCRFLLMLNTTRLGDAEPIWEAHHEKVIDKELTLAPSSTEAFDVAACGVSAPYLSAVRSALGHLAISNIRVIRKILKVFETIALAADIKEVPYSAWLNATVLLTAAKFSPSDAIPTPAFVLQYNKRGVWDEEERKPTDQEVGWKILLHRLGFMQADEFVEILIAYLETGLLDTERLNAQFHKFRRDVASEMDRKERQQFFTDALLTLHCPMRNWLHGLASFSLGLRR